MKVKTRLGGGGVGISDDLLVELCSTRMLTLGGQGTYETPPRPRGTPSLHGDSAHTISPPSRPLARAAPARLSAMGGASLGEKVNKIKHELGLDVSMPMAEALQTANGIMGLRPSNYTLPEQADLLLNVRRASNRSLDQRTTLGTRPLWRADDGVH